MAAGVGWLVMAFGVWVYDNEGNTKPALLVRWVLGTLLVHDLLVVPIVIAVGALVGWLLHLVHEGRSEARSRSRRWSCSSATRCGGDFGRRPGDPSALPLDYANSVLVVLAVIWVPPRPSC